MTEERFWYDFEDPTGHKILDFKNDNEYPLETIGDFREVVDLMNGLTAKNKVLHKEIERLKTQNEDILYNNAKNMESLEKENEELKQQLKDSQKRTAIISGWLHTEGNLTLDEYEEIIDYCYQEYKKENCE